MLRPCTDAWLLTHGCVCLCVIRLCVHTQVSEGQVLSLEPIDVYVSMLYVVSSQQGGVRTGERVFGLAAVRDMQDKVRRLRHRTEAPKGATDIFGETAPAPRELRLLRRASEHFFAGRRVSEDGERADADGLDGADADAAEDAGAPPPPAAPAAAKGGKPGAKGAAAADAAVPAGPVPTDLAFLSKLETLLNVDTGIELVDVGFAEYLAQALPRE